MRLKDVFVKMNGLISGLKWWKIMSLRQAEAENLKAYFDVQLHFAAAAAAAYNKSIADPAAATRPDCFMARVSAGAAGTGRAADGVPGLLH